MIDVTNPDEVESYVSCQVHDGGSSFVVEVDGGLFDTSGGGVRLVAPDHADVCDHVNSLRLECETGTPCR